ncbi:MAG: hypothetical protein SGILL_005133 [Bacillariaceae sp.]
MNSLFFTLFAMMVMFHGTQGKLRGSVESKRQLADDAISTQWRLNGIQIDPVDWYGFWNLDAVFFYPTDDCSGEPLDTSGLEFFDSAHYSWEDDPNAENDYEYFAPAKAFDNDVNTGWGGRPSENGELYIGAKFSTDVGVNCAKFTQNGSEGKPTAQLQYYDSVSGTWVTHRAISDAAEGVNIIDEAVTPVDSFLQYAMIFSGHKEVISMDAGKVNITWSPAFVYAVHEDESLDKFVDKGNYTYHVIVAKGEYTFSPEQSVSDLVDLHDGNDIQVFTTPDRSLQVTGLDVSTEYSVLVVAKTAYGQESFNRSPAVIEISSVDPVINAQQEVKLMPEAEDGSFSVIYHDESEAEVTVEISGAYPDIFSAVQKGDFVYVTGNGEYNQDVKLVQVDYIFQANGIIEWSCSMKSMYNDVFQTFEMDAVIADDVGDEDLDDMDFITDEEVDEIIASLPDKVKIDFCILTYNIEDSSCFHDDFDAAAHGRRALSKEMQRKLFFGFIKRAVRSAIKKVKQVAKKVAKQVRKVVKDVVEKIKAISVTVDRTITFLDIEKTAAMTCETKGTKGAITYDASFEIGVVFDLSAKARFKIKINVGSGLNNAMAKFFGGFGAKAYMELDATAQAEFAPEPLEIFKKMKTKTYWAGYVPVVIATRQTLESSIEANAAVEAEATASAQVGWDYHVAFHYDVDGKPGKSNNKFWIDSSFEQRDVIEDDPEFALRVTASVELAFLYSFDVILYGIVQASLNAELGANAKLEVSSTLESIVGTQPYWYQLDEFSVGAHVEVTGSIGLNNPADDVSKKIAKKTNSGKGPKCEFKVTGKGLVMPSISNNDSAENMPKPIEAMLDFATNRDRTAAWMDLTMTVLNETLPDDVKDFFGGAAEFVEQVGQIVEDAQAGFTIYEETIDIFGLPSIEIEMVDEPLFCQGDHAVTVSFEATEEESDALIKNSVKDWEWFPNFDGSILSEESDWEIVKGSETESTVTIGLKRTPGTPFDIDEDMAMFLRATPEKLASPRKSLFASFDVTKALQDEGFARECCDDSDCGGGYACNYSGKCTLPLPDCEDLNPNPNALQSNFETPSKAYQGCIGTCGEGRTQICINWEQNHPLYE